MSHPALAARRGPVLPRLLWNWRTELAGLGATLGVFAALRAVGLDRPALGLTIALFTVPLAHPRIRGWVAERLHEASLRRVWPEACRSARLVAPGGGPAILAVRRVPAGDRLVVRVPIGMNVRDLAAGADHLAAYLQLREVRVVADENRRRNATVMLVRRDTLAGTIGLPWPDLAERRTSLWEPVPVGRDEGGEVVAVKLTSHNLLLGGEPGSGKTTVVSLLLAAAAMDAEADLWLLDSRWSGLAPFHMLARGVAAPGTQDAAALLTTLRAEVDRRYAHMRRTGRRRLEREDGFRVQVVVIDELGHHLTQGPGHSPGPAPDGTGLVGGLLQDIAERGPMVGFVVLAASHRPTHAAVPPALRELFGLRWALRCQSGEAAETILGPRWRRRGYDPVTIGSRQPGVGYLLMNGESDPPVRLRSFHLSEPQLRAVAERGRHLRAAWHELGRPAA